MVSHMRRKIYNAAFFLLNNNESFAHSFGIRLKIVGLNLWIGGYAIARTYSSSLRLPSANDEKFE